MLASLRTGRCSFNRGFRDNGNPTSTCATPWQAFSSPCNRTSSPRQFSTLAMTIALQSWKSLTLFSTNLGCPRRRSDAERRHVADSATAPSSTSTRPASSASPGTRNSPSNAPSAILIVAKGLARSGDEDAAAPSNPDSGIGRSSPRERRDMPKLSRRLIPSKTCFDARLPTHARKLQGNDSVTQSAASPIPPRDVSSSPHPPPSPVDSAPT